MIEQIREQGFHAVENHFDIRAKLFGLLPTLNFRSFITIINKSKAPFKDLIDKKKEEDVYLLALDNLLRGRFNNRLDNNVFIFEELQFRDRSQQNILDDYFSPYPKGGMSRTKSTVRKNLTWQLSIT